MNSILYNLTIMMRKKTFRFSFLLVLALCIGMPFVYAVQYTGCSTMQLPATHTLYVGNAMGLVWDYFQLVFPVLVIFPYSMSFFEESKNGTLLYIQARSSRKQYYISQLITAFIGGFVIICIPFLINILLNAILFPAEGNDYLSTFDRYTYNWSGSITGSTTVFPVLAKGFVFKGLYADHPQLHNLLFALLAGVGAGMMAMLAYACSMVVRRNRFFLFLAMYLIFEVLAMVNSVLYDRWSESSVYVCTDFVSYLSNGLLQVGRSYGLFWGFMAGMAGVVLCLVRKRIEEDEV